MCVYMYIYIYIYIWSNNCTVIGYNNIQTCNRPTCFGILRPSSGTYSGYFPKDGRNSELVRLYADSKF